VHPMPRRDRAGAPQGHQGRAVGEGSERPAGLRRLPPAPQGEEGLLPPGDGRRRLPALPRGRAARPPRTVGPSPFASPTSLDRATPRSHAASATRT
jgi:hypothetical protein